jgi:hypothetical protein
MKRIIHVAVMAIAAAALTSQARAQVRDADGWLALQEPGMYAFSHPNGNTGTGYRAPIESHAGLVMTASKPAPKKQKAKEANQRSVLGR